MPPHVLFFTGDPAALTRDRAVAIVGTRRATTARRTTAGRPPPGPAPASCGRPPRRAMRPALCAADAAVVSGLPCGIDGAADGGTVRAGGIPVAVIGGGHAV